MSCPLRSLLLGCAYKYFIKSHWMASELFVTIFASLGLVFISHADKCKIFSNVLLRNYYYFMFNHLYTYVFFFYILIACSLIETPISPFYLFCFLFVQKIDRAFNGHMQPKRFITLFMLHSNSSRHVVS